MMSYGASIMVIVMAIPAVLIGAIATKADWTAVVSENHQCNLDGTNPDYSLTLPCVLR